MRAALLIGTLLLAAQAEAAFACSPIPETTAAETEGRLRATFARAQDFIEFVVIERVTPERGGRIRVTRSHKGAVEPGATVAVSTYHGSMCGPGEVEPGRRGRMFVTGDEPHLLFPTPDRDFAALVRLKLVPPR